MYKDDFKNFFYDFFLEIYPKFKVKVSKIENLDLLKKNFEDITIRQATLSEKKLHRLFGSINKINKKKIEFNKSRGVPLDFDEVTYYKINEDVYKNKVDAYDHYLKYGKDEGRLYSRHEYIYNEVDDFVFERFINI